MHCSFDNKRVDGAFSKWFGHVQCIGEEGTVVGYILVFFGSLDGDKNVRKARSMELRNEQVGCLDG